MAKTYGKLGPFKPESDSLQSYIERAKIYFAANEIQDEKQAIVFLSELGERTYAVLRNLVAPDLPQDKSLDEIVTALSSHYEPKPIVIAQRFHFHRRNQLPTESITEFVAELRRLSIHCSFGANLDEALRDRLVCGLRSENIQKRLLTIADLTFKNALDTALSMEAADSNANALHGRDAVVHSLHKARMPNKPREHNGKSQVQLCYRCGRNNHSPSQCKFIDATCNECGKKGHIAPACRSKKPSNKRWSSSPRRKRNIQAHYVEQEQNEKEADETKQEDLHLFTIGTKSRNQPIECEMLIEGVPIKMTVDTGAEVSLISEETKKILLPQVSLKKSNVVLRTYTEQKLTVLGEIQVQVEHRKQKQQMPLIVVKGEGPTLLGRDWLKFIQLDWRQILNLKTDTETKELKTLLHRYSTVFKDDLGTIKSHWATLQVRETHPKFNKARPVPFAIRDAVGAELDLLEGDGIIEKISHSQWAAPIVPVAKANGRFRICGDYSVSVNLSMDVDQYPLPNPSEMFATLAGGQKFTKLDLANAFQQLRIAEDSRRYTAINTHKGLYQYTRLPFGIASSPAIFQRVMDIILQGIPNVQCYIDDILITGRNDEGHLRSLEQTLRRLEEYGLRANKAKCKFMQDHVDFLGYRVDSKGIHTLPDKLNAIVKAPSPENIQQLRSFLGLLNYYGKFIPNLASLIHPLNLLLHKDTKWNWNSDCEKAFTEAKEALVSSTVLTHYDPELPLTLAGDASAYGIGAVISHVFPDGSEHPIAFASRTLTSSEQNYAQLEKEALSLIFGVKKFHQYFYGRRFTLITDHKPLLTILGPKKGIPSLAAARLQRWAVFLLAYRYDIKFKDTLSHANADSLSRLPLKDDSNEGNSPEASIFNLSQVDFLPVTANKIRQATSTDPVLSKVLRYTKDGWPDSLTEELKIFQSKSTELTIENGILLWGIRVIVPKTLQGEVMQELHNSHPGVTRMKSIARSYVWWPKIDHQIETLVKSCITCQSTRDMPPVAPLHPWVWPAKPWQRLHIDFAGPFLGKTFFILVDAHSKWPEIVEMKSTTSQQTIFVLRNLFATYGLPLQIVSDNGPQFTSAEFEHFLKMNGVKHILCSPYHPSSNGLAERFVKTFKRAMQAAESTNIPWNQRISNFLLCYRSTPHATTNRSPSSLFLHREVRTRLDLLRPKVKTNVLNQQANQVQGRNQHAVTRNFQEGEKVMVRNYSSRGNKWMPGIVKQKLGPLSYLVQVPSHGEWRRHTDQIRKLGEEADMTNITPPVDSSWEPGIELRNPTEQVSNSEPSNSIPSADPPKSTRYPSRNRHSPDYYGQRVSW